MQIRFRAILPIALLALAGCGESESQDTAPLATIPPVRGEAPATTATAPQTPEVPAAPGAAALELGKLAYDAQCVTCHGATGLGDGSLARNLPVKPRSFGADDWRHVDFGQSDDEVVSTITRVVQDGLPDAMMPGYARTLSDAQIESLVLYVLELRRQSRGN